MRFAKLASVNWSFLQRAADPEFVRIRLLGSRELRPELAPGLNLAYGEQDRWQPLALRLWQIQEKYE